ncbi:amiloride-sensitive sodium channel subunit gamma-2-like [Neodiprion virginianus]|uniref:amiloride-sensitive sodium channel subunit gamma-2-like n=1 Tax=Neodiprion virginianus TaxID=2961670 RepID=UPI001EE721B8|nr:amiloride-sensitive sodium channel subunit gamma-2-like [Neodiprion virginianus]
MNLKQATALPFPAVTVCNLNRVHCTNLRRLFRRNRGTELGNQLERLYQVTSCSVVRRMTRSNHRYSDNGNNVGNNHVHTGVGELWIDNDPLRYLPQGKMETVYRYTGDNSYANTVAKNHSDGTKSSRLVGGTMLRNSASLQTSEAPTSLATPTVSATDEEEIKPQINQTQSFNDLMNFLALYANFTEEDRIAMGHDATGFIRACTFSGKSCSNITLFFKTISSTSYGNCFTFTTTRRTVMPGKDYGLSMELFLDQSNYIGGGLSPRAGARVVVHPPSQFPLPNENGLTIPPHTATSTALVQVQVTREKLPYITNCTSGWERTWYEAKVGDAYRYSMEQCQRICLQLAFEDFCSCTHPIYMDISTGVSPCNLTSDNRDYACVGRVLEEFETRTRECSCNMDCREITYNMKISQAAWPNENNWCDVAQRFGMARACKYEKYRSDYRVREKQLLLQNVLTIDVFFENLRVQSIDQHPTYKLQSFVGSLGGALSLYLGITLFMLLEVFEVFVRLVFALFYRGCCFFYQRKLTGPHNQSHRCTVPQQGIFYTG